jgi:hypothetical protein
MRRMATTRRQTAGAAVLVAGLLAAGAAAAHHGWGNYDADNPLTITGPLTQVAFEQPHVHVRLEADGQTWMVILAPISRMQSRGATRDVLQVGTTVSAYGYPSRTDPTELRAERITVDGRTFELR